jgi:DNA-binding NarL/FixJ family response regulator
VDAIREIARGGTVLSPIVASKVMQNLAAVSAGAGRRQTWELTVRELEILETLQQGLRNADIAIRLDISTRTVEAHVGNIIAKLGAQSRTEAVRIAVEKKIIP